MGTRKCECGHILCIWCDKVVEAVDEAGAQEGAKSWWGSVKEIFK